MNVVMNYSRGTNMLQLAIFPEKMDCYQDIQHIQGRMNSRDIQSIRSILESATNTLNNIYEEGVEYEGDDWKKSVFNLHKWEVVTTGGYVLLEHSRRVLRLYMLGGCLTMNLKTLEDVLKQLEKIK